MAAFIGLILAGYFMVGFTKVALVGHELRQTKAQLQAEVAELEDSVATLEAQKQYVQSDAYVEEEARKGLKMSQPGDEVIVPLFKEEGTPSQASAPPPPSQSSSTPDPTEAPWQAWWNLFFVN